MEIITLNPQNIDKEDICCAIADKKSACGVNLKKEWLKDRYQEGYRFKKFNVRGKVFIEYGPVENAWAPVDAPGYTFIQCFWVAGSYKGQGLGSRLLDECLRDSKDRNGVIVVSASKKKPFLADKAFFQKKGFEVCDTAPPYFELLVKKMKDDAPLPRFKECVREPAVHPSDGLTVYYSVQCPFTDYYIRELIDVAAEYRIPLQTVQIGAKEAAQNSPSPFSIYSVFWNGRFVTHEILSKGRFEKIMHDLKIIKGESQ